MIHHLLIAFLWTAVPNLRHIVVRLNRNTAYSRTIPTAGNEWFFELEKDSVAHFYGLTSGYLIFEYTNYCIVLGINFAWKCKLSYSYIHLWNFMKRNENKTTFNPICKHGMWCHINIPLFPVHHYEFLFSLLWIHNVSHVESMWNSCTCTNTLPLPLRGGRQLALMTFRGT